MLRVTASVCVLTFSVAMIAATPGGGDSDAKMDGTWVAVSVELAGQKLPDEAAKTIKVVLKGGEYTVAVGDMIDRGTVKVDASKMPKQLDILGTEGPNKGKKFLAIYEMKGDTLRVCYDLSGESRPTEFATKPKTTLFLATYKREK